MIRAFGTRHPLQSKCRPDRVTRRNLALLFIAASGLVSCVSIESGSQARSQAQSARPLRVVIFGDSITAGHHLPPQQLSSRWISLIEKEANGALLAINEGAGGRPTDSLDEFVLMLDRQRPTDLLVIALGTNDSRDISGDAVSKAVANLRSMILAARKASGDDLPILIVGPPNINIDALGPTRSIGPRRQQNLLDMNTAFKVLAHEYRCDFVSLYGVVSDRSLLADGVHPEESGYLQIARKISPAIRKMFASKQKNPFPGR